MEPDILGVSGVAPYLSPVDVLHVMPTADHRLLPDGTTICRHELAGGWRVRVIRMDEPRHPLDMWRDLQHVRQVVDERPPEVVVLHGLVAGIAGRLVVRGRLPTVYVVHEEVPQGCRVVAAMVGQLERLLAAWTNVAVVHGAEAAERFVQAGVAAPLVTVPDDAARCDVRALEMLAAVIARAHAFGRIRSTAE